MHLRLTFILATLLLQACATNGPQPEHYQYAEYVSASKHSKLALEKLKRRDYPGALVHFHVLQALEPHNPEYKNQIRITRALASRRARIEVKKGLTQVRLGNDRRAESHFLRALIYQPENKAALTALRKMNTEEVKKVQRTHLRKITKKSVYLADSH